MELQALVQRISERIGGHLERKGLLVRDAESSHLAFDSGDEDSALAELRRHSITYRIALGPYRGRKAFMLQSLPSRGSRPAASGWRRPRDSRCTRGWRLKWISGAHSSGCAATLPGRQWWSSGSRSRRRATFATP